MSLPIVAIVGRPNVGKSSLFNWLAGRRISIVDPTAGVTRDRIATTLYAGDRYFDLVDTGGMGIQDVDNLTADVERQIRVAIEEAAVVLFLVDVRDGVVPLDQEVAERLRKIGKPIIFVANKSDDPKFDVSGADFYRLGYGPPLCVSAEQKRGKEELLTEVLARLPADGDNKAPKSIELKIAIVGRRNVGKSTFINSLAQADRVIVSEIAGTTRDSIDVRFERDGKVFLAIDTAGVRKKKSLAGSVEFYSSHRAERSIRRADVVLHFFDPRLRISRVDKQLAEYIVEHKKPAIFVVNKWDLAKDTTPTEKWSDYLRTVFSMLDYVPIAFITAKNGKNVYRLLNLTQQLHKQAGKRAKTGELNRVIQEAMLASNPPVRSNRVAKVYYATQVDVHPPTIVLITNGPELFDDTYIRYLTKTIRDSFPFGEVAVKLILRAKGESAGLSSGFGAVDFDQMPEPSPDTDTTIIPVLASEAPIDALDPIKVDEPAPTPETAAPAKKAPSEVSGTESTPRLEKPRKKKKPNAGTWEL
ncbi:ribosome biogenesis GTPase Der [Fimbriiglobus ruber]|uniref:GTPase Der n=1 Tax=Fimbriiglobus ruber TaxID=1908690 RepID=A0A225E7N4_9BACT|nr:ribosome biogenesis GTPase Der [Fimbriiglobus ruber]OWK46788.1 GTP-binding protein EngA [Fimbriiglobus ruber]